MMEPMRSEGARFVAAARKAGISAPVPSCGDWTMFDLCAHVARLHRWVIEIIELRPNPPSQAWNKYPYPEGDAIIDYVDEGYQLLADTFAGATPTDTAWSWTDQDNVTFWARRQTYELAVHRWDAQLACGEPEPIDREIAVDGIWELFDLMPYRTAGPPPAGNGETMHLHCTDGDGEWLIHLDPDGVHVEPVHAKGDVAARGTASDLYLFAWGRVPIDRLEVFGEASLLARWSDGRLT
jgi:uncharacterized protein (TIGR03083 family)